MWQKPALYCLASRDRQKWLQKVSQWKNKKQKHSGAEAAGRRILYGGGAVVELVVQLKLGRTGPELLLELMRRPEESYRLALLLPVSVSRF